MVDYLLVADAPMSQGGIPKCIDRAGIQTQFGLDYRESSIQIAQELLTYDFGQQDDYDSIIEKLDHRIREPLNETLVVCHINEIVGYGVFTKEKIAAGTIICLYSGELKPCEKTETEPNYGMRYTTSKGDSFYIDAEKVGGIARFIQHMPYSYSTLRDKLHRTEDLASFFCLLSSNGLTLTEETKSDYQSALENGIPYSEIVTEGTKEFISELKKSADGIDEPLDPHIETANIKSFQTIHRGGPIIYFQACRDIEALAQLGISYGRNYWYKKNINPLYFNKNGSIFLNQGPVASSSTAASSSTMGHETLGLFKDFFADPKPSLTKDVKLKQLLLLYKTNKDIEIPDIDKALRRAAFMGHKDNVASLLDYGASVNKSDDSPSSSKTALHHAAIKGYSEIMSLLIARGADNTVLDANNKTPLQYYEDYLAKPSASKKPSI